MQAVGLDALIVCGNQYAGFEGAVFYTSGFEIVHRYVYVVIPTSPASGCATAPSSANGNASVLLE